MSIAEGAPGWLVALLFLLLAVAAIEDGWRLRISNLIVIGVAATGIAAMVLARLGWDTWQPLILAIAILVVGTPLFTMGWMGGGDVKLLAASGLWFTLDGGWRMLAAVAVAGGLLTVIVLIIRFFRMSDAIRGRVALFRKGIGVPYGIAAAVGVTVTILSGR